MKRTGGKWNPKADPAYFHAGNLEQHKIVALFHSHSLCALNEIKTDDDVNYLEAIARAGHTVFIDSGVFSLAMSHARQHQMELHQVLALPPSALQGFDQLFEKYCRIVKQLAPHVWGYIELDLGGPQHKREMRRTLEQAGFAPIPVYHPMTDGWEYFDELASQYDRICIGNTAKATPSMRKRLLATAWERSRRYPDVWIHMLGLTPNQWSNAYSVNSSDSSSWLNPEIYGLFFESVTNFSFSRVSTFEQRDGDRQTKLGLSAIESATRVRNLHALAAEYRRALEPETESR